VVVDERPVGMTKGNDGGNFLDLLSLVCHVWHPRNMLERPSPVLATIARIAI